MSSFTRKILQNPSLHEHDWPASPASIADLEAAGWASQNMATLAFDQPIDPGFLVDGGLLIQSSGVRDVGERFATAPGAWDAIAAQCTRNRRDFTSIVIEFRSFGFDGALTVPPFTMFNVLALNPTGWTYGVQIVWNAGMGSWALAYLLPAGPQYIAIPNFVDAICNVIKVNLTRLASNQKRIDLWWWDSSIAGWNTATSTSVFPNIGNSVNICCFGWTGDVRQRLDSGVSFSAVKSMRASASDISLAGYTLPQM